ncbi:PREDICTED: rho GTPase-activating protein 7-like isoform X1 [Poecilia mexicana]|uniref:Rho GTPase-activating protein 7 n=1 Tax=Poecilia mexicana TaxID=48701 RepID=A0A3B3X8D6_9TELE|nr:PREDICTED: rho GTPase-activating protein 7-like isoform X1 [Poecilia mexicana]
MPVAIRKRSWEEHVTHPSGLQYSFDDLDLVCCHGVDGEGFWVGSGALKQGRRTRCASMPEGCQMPSDDLGRTTLAEVFAVDDVDASGRVRQTENNGKPLDFQETVHELVGAGLPQRNSKSAHLPATSAGISGGPCCYSNSNISSFTIDNQSGKPLYTKVVIGTESSQGYIFRDDVFTGLKEQQYISISSNKGPSLSESAGEQIGKLPTHQQTKESHMEGYSRSPEISEVTLNRCAGAGQESQTNCPDVEEIISTSNNAGTSGLLFAPQNSTDAVEDGSALSLPSKELFLSSALDEECDEGFTDSQSPVFVHRLGGLNELETKNENAGLSHLRNVQDEQNYSNCAVVLDQASDCEISKGILDLSAAAEQELQSNSPEIKGIVSISDQESAGRPDFVLQNLPDRMDSDNTLSVQPVVAFSMDEQCDKIFTQCQSPVFAHRLDGSDDSETLNENAGHTHHSMNVHIEEVSYNCAMALDESNDCEMLNQTLAEKHNVAKTARNWPRTLESAEQGDPFDTFHSNVKNQCLAVIETVSAEHQRIGNSERESTQTSTMCCGDQLVKTSLSQSLDNMVESSLPKESTACEDADIPLPIENNYSKRVTIPEIHLIEADDDDTLVKARKKTEADITENQDHNTLLDNKYQATEQHMKLPVLSKEVSKGLHGNQTSGLSESPCSEVADGYRENRSLGGRVSAMGELDDAIFSAVSSETPPSGSDVKGTHEAGDQKEDSVVKVRMRKHEHARLDSMVLLLMKLDQLDQEIENALSATSSMDSTPTLHRRHHLNTDHGPTPATSLTLPPPHATGTFSSGSAKSHGAKPKSEGLSVATGKKKAEIEAKEACTWLRAAGFPQYAQLYEDSQFPIDISSVTRDHDFLDRDAIEALCRRLNTLNKCALMRLEISPQRKRSEDSDEDEPCAISGRWTFQRDSKRWSRMEELEVFSSFPMDAVQTAFPKDQVPQKGKLTLREGNSSESVLTDVSEQPEVSSIHSSGSGGRGEEKIHGAASINEVVPAGATRASSVASMCSSSGTGGSAGQNEDSLSDGLPPSPLETLRHFTFDVKAGTVGGSLDREGDGGKSTRSRAKSFLKRMESLRLRSSTSSKRKKKGSAVGGKIEISGPVIKQGFDDDKLRRLNCVDISSINLNHHCSAAQTMTLNRNRSVSYSTQTSNGSTGSTGSSQSEASSGSAVSTPSPVTRARSHSTAAGSSKRGGMYLEGFDPFSLLQQELSRQPPQPKSAPPIPCQASEGMSINEQNRRNNCSAQDKSRQEEEVEEDEEEEEEEDEEGGMIFFYLPEGHKPGTFPKALQDGSLRNNNGNDNGNSVILRGRQSRRQRRASSGSIDSRLSFYDNVPYAEKEEGEDEDKLEEVLQHVTGFVNAWSEAVAGEEEEEEEDEEEEGDSDSALDSASPCPSSPLQNRLEETENGSDQDSTGNPLGDVEDGMRERRDSGVGASLTRTSRPQKLRWPSFQNSHRPSLASAQLQISCQSVLQMNLLQKLSLLQLTALLEKHTPTNKHGFSWAVPKFMKRIKVRDYKDRNVFGVPLQVIVQRTGQPLPQGIQQAMRYLRNQCLDQVGLFRKSGVKSRIQALRQMNEASGADGGGVNYEGQSAYDVADMLKQYFRDLPEPLLTSKLSETFLQIYQYMPKELRLQATRAAVLLLPDENREALRTLLCLLCDVTASVAENQMTPTNLAVCLAPSLFHLNTLRRKESSSPRVMNRKQMLGKPDQRDLNENLAATHGLAHMIQECRKLFRIPEEMNRCRNSYLEQALLPQRFEELAGEEAGQGGYRACLQDSLDLLLKEAKDKFKGYDSCSTPEHAELACRKVHDGFPLRLWKVTVEIPASPDDVLTRVLREQGHWDEDLLESRVVETLDERTEIYQYVRNAMAPHPTRDHLLLRTWITDLPKGACALVSTSVDHEGVPVVGVRANVLTSRYYIEPCGTNKSRLTHISRTDLRGRFPEWYNKLHGQLCAAEVARIRDSFTVSTDK